MARTSRIGKARRSGPRPPQAPPQTISIEQAIDLAHRHWEAGQLQEAELLCRKVLEVVPGQIDVHHLLGLIANTIGQIDVVIDHLGQACADSRAPWAYFNNLAELCRRRGRLAEAEHAACQAVARDRNQPAAWSNLGIILQESGRLEASVHCLRRVLVLMPDFAEGYNNLGNTMRLQGWLPGAAAHYNAALILNPSYADAFSNLGGLASLMEQPDFGLDMLRQAIGLEPRMADAYINASALEGRRGRWGEALSWLDALGDFAPDHPWLPGSRARALARLGRAAEAITAARVALTAIPANPEALHACGLAQLAQGRPAEARSAFLRVAALGGPMADEALAALQPLEQAAGGTERP